MHKSKNGNYFLRSAFQFSYFGIFVIAVFTLAQRVLVSDNSIAKGVDALSDAVEHAGQHLWIIRLFAWPVRVFMILFAVHLIRVYVTLESMEDEEGTYGSFYDSFPAWARLGEFCIRATLIAVVSLHVLNVKSFSDFAVYVRLFYLGLLTWSLFAIFVGRKGILDAFLPSSLMGLIFSGACWLVDRASTDQTGLWQLGDVIMILCAFGLFVDLGLYLKDNGPSLIDEYYKKLTYRW